MTDRAAHISDGDLRTRLRDLLSGTDADGNLDPQAFWTFVTGLAQGRGISDGLRAAGLEALGKVKPDGMAATFNFRRERAYHIALLSQLLADLGASVPGGGSMLPANFNCGAILGDLTGMLAGPGGMGDGDPQILTTSRQGDDRLRQAARQRLVGVVRWRMGRDGQTRDAVWRGLMGDDAEKTRLDRWQAEAGGPDGALARAAYAAGRAKDKSSPFAASNTDLAGMIKLANSGPGYSSGK